MGVFRGVLGQGSMLCQNSDSTFTAHKKMLVPSFTASSLDKHAMPIMHTSIDRLFKLWSSIPDAEAGNDKGGPLMDAERSISLLTKEIMLRFIFGADLGVLEKSDGNAQQAHQVVSWIEVVFDTLNPIPIITPFKRTFNIRYHYARFRLFRWMGQQIDQCMAEDESVPMVVDGMAAPWSVMKECLRRNQTNGLSTNEVRDELFTLLLAGDDTVASQLCWILNHLIFNPDTQRRIREELEMLPSQPELSYAEIMGLSRSLPVLSSFVSESLRLAGTIPLTSREAIRDTFLLSTTDSAEAIQYPIKKGTSIVLLLDATGKGAEVEAGKTFNLDRWLDPESGEYDASRVGSHPFSLGTRACFGIRFAQLFLRLFVARLVQEYDLFSPSMAEKSEQQQRGKEIQVREVISRRPLETKVRLRQMRDT
ncbi:Cytochrome P450 CYP4/CYP19/CYP26 subfamilies [Phaffia rhodozyma]|uniref:Cytochrome P450 CYP4/CYP19/CYP26 subfamilies n=1 Tax=Phaffia rhodozyma TaxID=264483 RepID=A0A0F7SM35_PHARH|nr:Cytochrome P450 CYP4/CYP19/CYP26 subfamilies [Phaffia rhodozyma]